MCTFRLYLLGYHFFAPQKLKQLKNKQWTNYFRQNMRYNTSVNFYMQKHILLYPFLLSSTATAHTECGADGSPKTGNFLPPFNYLNHWSRQESIHNPYTINTAGCLPNLPQKSPLFPAIVHCSQTDQQ